MREPGDWIRVEEKREEKENYVNAIIHRATSSREMRAEAAEAVLRARMASVNVTRGLSLVSPTTRAIQIGKSFSYRATPFELSCQMWL